MNDLQAVFFDLDGTLIDSEYYYFKNWGPIIAEEFGIELTFEDWVRHFAGHTLVSNVETIREVYGVDTTVEFMWTRTRAAYESSDMTTINLMPYAREILTNLKEKGTQIALVTSSYRTTVDKVLGHHGLLPYFSIIITRDSVQQPKPNPEPYLLAVEEMGIDAQNCLVIEDTITGTTAAQAAGLYCIAVSEQPIEREKLKVADQLFSNLEQVWNFLKN
ncbi:HAD family hydrolase [Sphingobacterium sp. SYP-B4668]|uniref:HAD family hydrolase n=1 Tax=Sphingobacterium sp. SYP-B4668 TaxID=2996035 RepID=UPI0022DE2838|nr:HAD family phosphatase [Sphingobacterium sp. SYP-B4668]